MQWTEIKNLADHQFCCFGSKTNQNKPSCALLWTRNKLLVSCGVKCVKTLRCRKSSRWCGYQCGEYDSHVTELPSTYDNPLTVRYKQMWCILSPKQFSNIRIVNPTCKFSFFFNIRERDQIFFLKKEKVFKVHPRLEGRVCAASRTTPERLWIFFVHEQLSGGIIECVIINYEDD